jgi:hypothetical protein
MPQATHSILLASCLSRKYTHVFQWNVLASDHHSPCNQLIAYDPELKFPVSSIPLSILPEAWPIINCFQVSFRLRTRRDPVRSSAVFPALRRKALDYLCVYQV